MDNGYMRLESRGRSVPILHYKKELAELMLEFNTFSSLCYVTICDPFYTSKIISVIFIDRLLSICTVIQIYIFKFLINLVDFIR